MRQLYNIELSGRMEQKKGWKALEQWENVEIGVVACLGFSTSNPDVATDFHSVFWTGTNFCICLYAIIVNYCCESLTGGCSSIISVSALHSLCTRRTGVLVLPLVCLLGSTKLPTACNTSKVGWMRPYVTPGTSCVRPLGTSLVYGKGNEVP